MTKDPIKAMRDKMAERDRAYAQAHALSAELWELAEKSGLGVSELARELDVTRAAVYSWKKRRDRAAQS